jgi:hypothetical protein
MLSHPLSKQNWQLSMPSSAALRLNVPRRPKGGPVRVNRYRRAISP